MKDHDALDCLNKRIREQENKCETEHFYLVEQFDATMEILRPANVIRDALVSSVKELNLLDSTISIATGFIAKKLFVRSSHNPLLKLVGTIVGMGVANIAVKHPEQIRSFGKKLLDFLHLHKSKTGQV
ncbi:MAG TPA: hypothetical protein VL651_15635 [Bacteroidia bacterium]|jgi:hypothetical protein|nr:hypothetical protein [Bacteroidia bacterium]